MKFLFTLLKCISTLHQCNAVQCDSEKLSFSAMIFSPRLMRPWCGVLLVWGCTFHMKCFFLFDSAVIFQLKIIYIGVHCVSYQQKRYSYFQRLACVCSQTVRPFDFQEKMMLKDTCKDTSWSVLFSFLMKKKL